jgi:hypothetical protein
MTVRSVRASIADREGPAAALLAPVRLCRNGRERALGFVPIATLSPLVVASLAGRPDDVPLRLVALAGGRAGCGWAS